jgi:hypothetical protein
VVDRPVLAPETDPAPSGRARLRLSSALAAFLAAGALAAGLGALEWQGFVGYRSPYTFDLPRGRPTPALTERVVLVIVDGLRVDVSRTLPTFVRLGEQGSSLTAHAALPSLSFPGWSLLTTGAPPEVTGITTNWYEGAIPVDSLFAEAEALGVPTALVGSENWEQLYGEIVDRGWFRAKDDARSDALVGRRALRLLDHMPRGLVVVHLPDVDNVGHLAGVSSGYVAAARRADAVVGDIVEAAGPETTVILTSDHGHIEQGGHGGPEDEVTLTPLVLRGPGVIPGRRGLVSQADVAPTIAALLGLPRPTHAVGTIPDGLLDADPNTISAIRSAHREVSARFFAAAGRVVGGVASDAPSFERLRASRSFRDLLLRAPLALLVLAGLAFAVGRASRGDDRGAILVGVAAFVFVWGSLFVGRGLTPSFSHFNTEDQIAPFLAFRAFDAVIAGLAAGIAAGAVAARRGTSSSFRVGLAAVAWTMLLLAIPVAGVLAVIGWGYTWWLPDLSLAFGQFLLLMAGLGLGMTAGLAGLVAREAGRLFARPEEPRPGRHAEGPAEAGAARGGPHPRAEDEYPG